MHKYTHIRIYTMCVLNSASFLEISNYWTKGFWGGFPHWMNGFSTYTDDAFVCAYVCIIYVCWGQGHVITKAFKVGLL